MGTLTVAIEHGEASAGGAAAGGALNAAAFLELDDVIAPADSQRWMKMRWRV